MAILLLVIILLTGCSSFEPNLKTQRTSVSWVTVEDINTFCRKILDGSYLIQYHGCVRWHKDFSSCTIYTSNRTNHFILGHEFRHCFEGHFHQ